MPELPSWVSPLASQLWSFLAVALAVNALGTVSKSVANKLGWRRYRRSDVTKLVRASRVPQTAEGGSSGDTTVPGDASWYDITLRLHGMIGGALFGLLPLPTLTVIDAMAKDPDAGPYALVVTRCAWFMLAGALSGQIYEAVKFAFTEGRSRIAGLFGRSPSSPKSDPPPGPDGGNG